MLDVPQEKSIYGIIALNSWGVSRCPPGPDALGTSAAPSVKSGNDGGSPPVRVTPARVVEKTLSFCLVDYLLTVGSARHHEGPRESRPRRSHRSLRTGPCRGPPFRPDRYQPAAGPFAAAAPVHLTGCNISGSGAWDSGAAHHRQRRGQPLNCTQRPYARPKCVVILYMFRTYLCFAGFASGHLPLTAPSAGARTSVWRIRPVAGGCGCGFLSLNFLKFIYQP